jgi:hypothetical protein
LLYCFSLHSPSRRGGATESLPRCATRKLIKEFHFVRALDNEPSRTTKVSRRSAPAYKVCQVALVHRKRECAVSPGFFDQLFVDCLASQHSNSVFAGG